MSWVIVAIGTLAVSGVVSADQQRKATNAQKDAINASKAEDLAQQAKAEEGANAALIANKKRRRAAGGLLASTDPAAMPIGTSVLGSAVDGRMTAPRTTLGGP